MKILVLNSGSSSVKYQLIETSPELMAANRDRALARGLVEKIGEAVPDHHEAVRLALAQLTDPQHGAIGNPEEIAAVGHRIVHGGEYFFQPVRITDEVVRRIEECSALAPLHNPHNLSTYYATLKLLPKAAHVAVFDTAFHRSLPREAYTYGLPFELCARHKLRRYGFHGTSHRYVALRFAEIQGSPLEQLKLITCHLGNGCSMCAIAGGRSVDTSMGMTPLEGLLMGTRAGDTDLGAVLHLMQWEGLDTGGMDALLNHQSGLLGISGLSKDMRTVLAGAGAGNDRARLAVEVFCYRIRRYIGAYYAVLNGADALIFTAGIGENAPDIRSGACRALEALGILLDETKNRAALGVEAEISAAGAAISVWVIPTNEELLIARDTLRLLEDR